MTDRIKRPNWYDFQTVTIEDLRSEQSSYLNQTAESTKTAIGTGVRLDFPQEKVVFDSDQLTLEQAGYVAVSTFDGRGILSEPYSSTDQSGGNQLAVEVS